MRYVVSTPFLVFVFVYDLFIFFLQLFYLCRSFTSVYPFSTGEVGNFRGFLNDQTGACVFIYLYTYLLMYECACACAFACACLLTCACRSHLSPLVFRDGTKLQSDYETSIEYFIYDYISIYLKCPKTIQSIQCSVWLYSLLYDVRVCVLNRTRIHTEAKHTICILHIYRGTNLHTRIERAIFCFEWIDQMRLFAAHSHA